VALVASVGENGNIHTLLVGQIKEKDQFKDLGDDGKQH
jgi:hypothetical protein